MQRTAIVKRKFCLVSKRPGPMRFAARQRGKIARLKAPTTTLQLFMAMLLAAPALAEVDQRTGLVKDDNWELIGQHCAACHSLKLVTANRFDRETWLETIRWMQKTQKLWQFEPEVEDKILTYLATNYAPTTQVRRPAIAPHLMPQ